MLIALGRDPYSFFLRVLSRAYLLVYNLGWVGKSAELYKLKRMVKKFRATWTVLISIYVLQVAMVGQFSMKARMCLRFPPYEAVALAKHLKGCKAPASCSPFFFPTKVDETPFKKMPDLDDWFHVFYDWPLNAVLHRKLSVGSFRRKCYTIKDGIQTYDFVADRSCLLFSIILKGLSGSEK